jgi:hypothetical protein
MAPPDPNDAINRVFFRLMIALPVPLRKPVAHLIEQLAELQLLFQGRKFNLLKTFFEFGNPSGAGFMPRISHES